MAPKTNVNNRSLVHASSVGVSTAFPDACKTPTPGGPVPVPYPNVAMSSDTAGTGTVKADGAACMTKGTKLSMSSGDEAGSAGGGVASNKIKGEATFSNCSFDVKIEGEGAARLADPMQQNKGASANTVSPAIVQAMFPGVVIEDPIQDAACNAAAGKAAKTITKDEGSSGWQGSGIILEHQPQILKVVTDQRLKVVFRQTKGLCEPWIRAKYQPKPHSIINGTTIGGSVKLQDTEAWLEKHKRRRDKRALTGEVAAFDRGHGNRNHTHATATPTAVMGKTNAKDFEGIVGSSIQATRGKPLLANRRAGTFAKNDYKNKYVTGDYDLQEILFDEGSKCRRLAQTGSAFGAFQREVNKAMGWDGIQHGPQAQWVAQEGKEHAVESFSMPEKVGEWLNGTNAAAVPTIGIGVGRPRAKIIDDKLTVVTPRGASPLESHEEVKSYLVCCGCRKPAETTK